MALFSVPIHHTTSYQPPEILVPIPEPAEEIKQEPIDVDKEAFCNCYLYAELYTGYNLPPMAEIKPNLKEPEIGSVAVMWYGNVKHVAVVTEVGTSTITISEGNYHRCQKTDRTISKSYSKLVGFYEHPTPYK